MTNHLNRAKEIIASSPLCDIWEKIGIKHHIGFSLPLFSLHSENSCGIGEYLDLIPLIDFAKDCHFDIIQLLPINDSGEDPSPYNALSSIALHPLYVSLHALPFVDTNESLIKQMKKLKTLNTTERVDYHEVLKLKRTFFKDYFDLFGQKLVKTGEFQSFLQENPWVKKYALYKTLKESMTVSSWQKWPEKLKNPNPEDFQNLLKLHSESITFYSFIQFLCFSQMKQVKDYASKNRIFIKGDVPILISPDSADVWLERHLFSLDYVIGHPPDVFNSEGQMWGFPSYNWEEMDRTNFAWWQLRLNVASNFYHMYRLDHVAGFYRLWHIPYGKKPKEGFWSPKRLKDVVNLGHTTLKRLISFSSMLPIAEDLGIIPEEVFESLRSLGIPGTRVIRWMREKGIKGPFFPLSEYYPINMTSVSTHDSETLTQWWNDLKLESKAYAKFRGWEYKAPLTTEQRILLLKDAIHTPTLLHINLLQEYLALIPSLVHDDPKKERINLPGFILPENWTYRFKPSLEQIKASDQLKNMIKEVI